MNEKELIEKLKKENEKLKEELEKVRKEFESQKQEFDEHKQHCSVLKTVLPSFIKEEVKHSHKSPGQKVGHKAYTRRIPERIDHIKVLNPNKCPECNSSELSETQEIRKRYVTDINIIVKPINTEYNIHRKYCRNCKKIVEEKVKDALPNARFGLKLMLLIMYLRFALALPCNKICDLLKTMYDIQISSAEIIVVLRQLTKVYGDSYIYLEKLVKSAKVKNSDTTGWRINGKNFHVWVFICKGVVLYKIRRFNSSKIGVQIFGRKQHGNILTVDRHSAFRALAEKVGFLLQLCWFHILQDSKGLFKDFGAEGKYVHEKLKEIYARAKSLNNKGNTEQVQQLQAEVFLLTMRHYKHATIRRFVDNLYYRDIDNLFRFVTNPDIPSTNNVSERELRKFVIMRKISNGSRSKNGADITAMLLSIVQTLRMRKINVLQGLQNLAAKPSEW